MLVDDENLALLQLERMITNAFTEHGVQDQIQELKSFQLVQQALDYAKQSPPDLIFLDIQMPEITGLEAAEYFQQMLPEVEIIFVTAYDEFAVKAFELNAMDYLLKPVSASRLSKTVNRIMARRKDKQPQVLVEKPQAKQKIYCFNHIRFQVGDGIIEYPKWRTAKAQELFAFLLHHRGEFVPKYSIINMFSPELDKKRAMTQLYTVIYQIRKCVKEANLEIKIDNDSIQEGYCLRLENTVIDVEQWEKELNQLQPQDPQYYNKLEELLYQYEGDYMGNYDYLWAESERERLRQLWISNAKDFLQHLYAIKDWSRLLKLGDKMNSFSPYEFEYGIYMMEAYDQLGQYDKLKQFYEKQEQTMLEELDLPLPEDMIHWYEAWLASRKGIQNKV
ncbi:response regulator [Paenibacillus montaniterrae]|nr:response regulator [Paenibacillus montaniterrae]